MPTETLAKTEEEITSTTTNETVESKDMGMQTLQTLEGKPLDHNQMTEESSDTKKVSAKRIKPRKKKSWTERLNAIGTIKQKEVVEFTRHLSVMLSAGVTIFEAINFLKEQTKNKVFSTKLEDIIYNLNNGQSLSASMSRYPKVFPGVYTNIVHVGEQSGSLPETMLDLADHLEESDKFKNKVKSALIYPKIILGVMVTFLFVLFLFVMPRILTIFESLNAEIPTATKVTIGITNFVQNNTLLIFLTIIGGIIGSRLLLRIEKIKRMRDLFYIKVPLVGQIVLNYNTTQIAQHFGTLFASGLTIVKCLEVTKKVVNNKIFQDEIQHMIEKIQNGSSFSQSFQENSQFPPMFIKLIHVGERTGKLPHVVDYLKNYYKNLVDTDVKNITTIIEPVIMVLLGAMVAGLVITVIGPIYQLISNVGR